MRVKYIHSDAILFLKNNNKFRGANSAILDIKFTSSSMEERWKMIAFAKLRHNALKRSFSSEIMTYEIYSKQLGKQMTVFLH